MKQQSIKKIYIKYSMISSFVVSSLSLLAYAISYPVNFSEFFSGFVVMVIPLSVAVGGIIGAFVSIYVTRAIDDLSRTLEALQRGNFYRKLPEEAFAELKGIESQIDQLARRLEEQTVTMQKRTNEKAEKEQELLEAAISGERNRLARELHDSVSQQLFAISMMSSAMNEQIEEGAVLKKQLQMLEEMSIQTQGEMRALLLHLRPIQLEGKKLTDGIRELLTELSTRQQLKITWHVDDLELEKGVEDHLFRILQEAISNTLRHAEANSLEIRLRKIEPFAIMRIIDDGVGFDPEVRKVGSYGLESMRERVNEVGGTLKIMSLLNKGTQIEVKVPLLKEGYR